MMKLIKLHKVFILVGFLFSFIILNPLQFIIPQTYLTSDHRPTLAQPENVLRMGVTSQIVTGNWDTVSTDGYNVLEYYKKNSLEPLLWLPDDSTEPKPHLAVTWEYEYWPDNETNAIGFNNTGGVKAIDITLRNGVEFHDGSNWNATVAKWNIDRLFVITGNLTGNANGIYDQRNTANYWADVEDVMPYFTASWNLSEYDAPDTLIVGGTPVDYPDPSEYSYYYLTDPDGPSPVIANNSNPYGGWDSVANNWIHYAPYDKFPLVRWVEIVEDLISGGKIRVEFNSWDLSNIQDQVWTPQISMQTYNNYYETGIYGYQNGNDMIGTGPYIYVDHDELADRGSMIKNVNYWNRTALEVNGWFGADRVEIIQFTPDDLGKDAQNAALLIHDIDYVYDSITVPIDYAAVMANPNIDYIEDGVADSITQITLNSINETWWTGEPSAQFSWVDISSLYPYTINADPAANGIPRPLREALNFAFDYDGLINIDLNDRAVRAGGMLGVGSVYYDSSVPLADYNLTYAREVLLNSESDIYSLTDPVWPENADNHNFSKQLSLRGLTDPTDDPTNNALWRSNASSNPIFTINFYWDEAHQDLADQFELACNNLGVAIVQDADNKVPAGTTVWSHVVSTYWTKTFDGVHSIWSAQAWSMDYPMPETNPLLWVEANYGDPNNGTWRAPTYNASNLWPAWNFGFSYDTEVDYWLTRVKYSNQAGKQYWFNKIAEKEQTDLYPMIYVYQGKEGRALWKDWEFNNNRGDIFFANFRHVEPPGPFSLFSDAETPDIDGNFNLNWSSSSQVNNYSLYSYNNSITEINGSVDLLINQTATSPISISGLSSGEYYYVVVAYNLLGDRMSNNVHITVDIPESPTDIEISGYNILIFIGFTISTSVILIKKKKRKSKRK